MHACGRDPVDHLHYRSSVHVHVQHACWQAYAHHRTMLLGMTSFAGARGHHARVHTAGAMDVLHLPRGGGNLAAAGAATAHTEHRQPDRELHLPPRVRTACVPRRAPTHWPLRQRNARTAQRMAIWRVPLRMQQPKWSLAEAGAQVLHASAWGRLPRDCHASCTGRLHWLCVCAGAPSARVRRLVFERQPRRSP